MRLILFVVSPLLTFLYSCFDLRRRSAQLCVVLFFGLFGYCHSFEDVRADSRRKYETFTRYTPKSLGTIVEEYREGTRRDVYEQLLFSAVRRVTPNPHIMMMVVGLVAGYIYMLVLKRFMQDRAMNYDAAIVVLVLMMIIESNIALMGGIRNFTAFPLYIYSLLRLTLDNRRIWLVGLLLTPLIHFSYIIAVVVALVAWLVHLPRTLLHYLAITACLASLLLDTSSYVGAIELFTRGIDNAAIAERVTNYGSSDTEAHFNRSLTTRLLRLNNQLSALYIVALLIYLRGHATTLRTTPYIEKIYPLLLLFVSFSFALTPFSVVGQRYIYIAMVLLYLYLLNLYQHNRSAPLRRFILVMPFIFALHIAWTLYNCYCVTGWGIYLLPLPLLI